MDQNSFWLADISDHSATVSLISSRLGQYHLLTTGPLVDYDRHSPDSLVSAVDRSLSTAADNASLSESAEPDCLALIIPPHWVGSDGKIITDQSKPLNQLFKELKLRPMGFIANDEAVVEAANQADGFPASFVLVNIGLTDLTVSLVYLGKVTSRSSVPLDDSFNPSLLEDVLVGFQVDSTLPPQIILIGQVTPAILDLIKNHPWIGRKDIETFLHFPEIKHYSPLELNTIYLRAITSQLEPPPPSTEPAKETSLPVPEASSLEAPLITSSALTEVSAVDLGFGEPPLEVTPEPVHTSPSLSSPPFIPKFTLPQVSLPKVKFRLPSANLFLYPFVLSPLLILIPFFFSVAKITLFLTPYSFNKTLDVTLDSEAADIDTVKKIIPVNRQSFEITNSASTPPTGRKVVGDRATGEVIVYNRQDKLQSLSKGTLLIDGSGRNYQLITSAQIASSSANLDAGVINLGQTKVMISAVEIGPEYNLARDARLRFKDYPEITLMAKVSQGLSGGTKREVSAISSTDKANLEKQLVSEINNSIEAETVKRLGQTTGIIKNSVQIKKNRIDFSREVGEEAAELTATTTSTIYLYYLDSSRKSQLLSTFLSSEPGFADSKFNLDDFDLSFVSRRQSLTQLQGQLTISGKTTPKIDNLQVAKMVSGKSQVVAANLIKKNLPRVYNYQIETNLSFLRGINPLPFLLQNIKIEVK